MLGFDINDLSKTITQDELSMRIEDIKDAYNDEYNNICYKFNCKIKNKNFIELDDKEGLMFIKKIINSNYGFEIKKDGDNYKMNIPNEGEVNMWNKLYEYKNNKTAENKSLSHLISPININDHLDEIFIED